MSKISEQTNALDLYSSFKFDFFELLDKKVGHWEECDEIKEHYNNFEFHKIRNIIENKVETWQERVLEAILIDKAGDIISNLAYKNWKEVDNLYSEFNDKYTDLIELNIV